jgi:biopolymer transport protein ExbB
MRRLLGIGGLLALAALLLAGPAAAVKFGQAAGEVRQELDSAKKEKAQTQAAVAQEKLDLRGRVRDLKKQISGEKARLKGVRAQLAVASRNKAQLARRLVAEGNDLKELAGHVRAAARDLLSLAEHSPATAENPGRLDQLRPYLGKSRFPGLADIEALLELYFAEMASSGLIKRREGKLVDREGKQVQADILRLGAFTTLYRINGEVGFATLGPGTGRLLAIAGKPDWGTRRGIEKYFDGESNAVALDISGGGALRQLSRRETLWEQLESGGPLIWPILLVGLVALVLIVERLLFLRKVRANTDEMMVAVAGMVAAGDYAGALAVAETQPGRPTSNVIQAGLSLKDNSREVIENGLSEAMLHELPRLERFLAVLKVLAAVAPLLGLLGTVTGMINTFQVITVFGTGNPRLMAGGISEALVTTQLGLAVAIPILVAASLLGRRAQRIASDMEEKAMALSAALIKAGN